MVPEEKAVFNWDVMGPFDGQISHLIKISKQVRMKAYGTYFLPVGTFSGLISTLLNALNQSSIGQPEKECGPL